MYTKVLRKQKARSLLQSYQQGDDYDEAQQGNRKSGEREKKGGLRCHIDSVVETVVQFKYVLCTYFQYNSIPLSKRN